MKEMEHHRSSALSLDEESRRPPLEVERELLEQIDTEQ
jgi:hypothetical protein